ncbi:MAG: D-aminoacyl-tRNA deacylase [Chloroflexota bacterium]
MRTVIQRVKRASVTVAGEVVGAIDQGFLILLGIGPNDSEAEAKWLAEKIALMRIFEDDSGKFNRSLLDVGGGALVVSQFTLYADASYGRRPSFIKAARPEVAEPLVNRFAELLRVAGVQRVEMGRFGTMMLVDLQNDGPTTIILEREPNP